MTPKIHANSPPPWENGGSTIDRWESGLIRVAQEYLCPTAQRDAIAATFAVGAELTGIASPATDGLYIYPAPQTQDLNNGFSKISVSAYGRIADLVSLEMTYRRVTLTIAELPVDFYAPSYRMAWVMRSGDLPVPASLQQTKYKDIIYRISSTTSGERMTIYNPQYRALAYTASPATGYGEMQEQIFNIEITPTSPY